jgi:hypothetical protein
LPGVVSKAGIEILIGRVYPNANRKFERKLKRQKNTSRVCNICREEKRKCQNLKP